MELKIKNESVDNAEKIYINRPQWGFTKYIPEVYVRLSYDNDGFNVKFTVMESEPLCEKTENFSDIHEDSCVEFFAKFDPENSKRYMNFEVNAIGTVKAMIRYSREDFERLSPDDIEQLDIKTEIFENYWTVSYKVKAGLLERMYSGFSMEKCKYIEANFYKCGNNTKIKHYLSVFDVGCEKPDFHRPEYFGRINLVRATE